MTAASPQARSTSAPNRLSVPVSSSRAPSTTSSHAPSESTHRPLAIAAPQPDRGRSACSRVSASSSTSSRLQNANRTSGRPASTSS